MFPPPLALVCWTLCWAGGAALLLHCLDPGGQCTCLAFRLCACTAAEELALRRGFYPCKRLVNRRRSGKQRFHGLCRQRMDGLWRGAAGRHPSERQLNSRGVGVLQEQVVCPNPSALQPRCSRATVPDTGMWGSTMSPWSRWDGAAVTSMEHLTISELEEDRELQLHCRLAVTTTSTPAPASPHSTA